MRWQEIAGLASAVIAILTVTLILTDQLNQRITVASQFLENRMRENKKDSDASFRSFYDYVINLEIRVRQLETDLAKARGEYGPDADEY